MCGLAACSTSGRNVDAPQALLVGSQHYQTKTPYAPLQDLASYEEPPVGFRPVYTQLVARHGSRGLSSMKSDLAIYNLWRQAQADGALTPLGERLGPDVLQLMKANFLLGYGVEGISNPGYGNESLVGISEHKKLAQRMLQRLPGLWDEVAKDAPARELVVVTSGVDRAVDSGNYFVQGLVTGLPALNPLIRKPAAPGPYPEGGSVVAQPEGTNRFLLYFHKLVKGADAVTNPANPLARTYAASQAYQRYKNSDPELQEKQATLLATDAANHAGRAVLERLFTKAFIERLASGQYRFSNSGTMAFVSEDGKFLPRLTGDGKATIESLADAGTMLYELYAIAPGLREEAKLDFSVYMPLAQARVFAELNDAADFYDKGPGMTEKGDVSYKMAQILVDDLFAEVDAIADGQFKHAAKLRFAHAEIMIPLAAHMGLPRAGQQLGQAYVFSYASNPWRGAEVSPMAANMQWDVYRNGDNRLLVKLLYNEKETDFKASCSSAKLSATSYFYDYAKLKACYYP
nr:histidine-type phosphatase [Rhodoferax aquaticus]